MTVEMNVQIYLDGMSDVYLRFSSKPSEDVREALKAGQFHWNGNGAWVLDSRVPAPEGFAERTRTHALPLLRKLFPDAPLHLDVTRTKDKALLRAWMESEGVVVYHDGQALSEKAVARILS